MRKEGGMKVIMDAIERLSKTHAEHISQYGTGNEERLTGKHEVCPGAGYPTCTGLLPRPCLQPAMDAGIAMHRHCPYWRHDSCVFLGPDL